MMGVFIKNKWITTIACAVVVLSGMLFFQAYRNHERIIAMIAKADAIQAEVKAIVDKTQQLKDQLTPVNK